VIEPAAFVIRASGHVVDFVVAPVPPENPVAALQAAVMRGERQGTPFMVPLVSTGVHSGPVDLTVEVLGTRPEATPPDWEDIHEVSLMLPVGRAYFNTPTGWEMKDIGTNTGDEKGSHRARLHATGRDVAFDLVMESPAERHLVQFWKEPPSPVSILSSEFRARQKPAAFHQNVAGPGTANRHRPRRITTDDP
jgi:hypothetical protein